MSLNLIEHVRCVFENSDALKAYVTCVPEELNNSKVHLVRDLPGLSRDTNLILPEDVVLDEPDTHKWVIGMQHSDQDEVIFALIPSYSGIRIPGRKGFYIVQGCDVATTYSARIASLFVK